jgi:glutathione S-transferase
MSLKLYMHPLSSYCHKALIALYENDTPFEAMRIDQADVSAQFKKLWPIGRFPVLRDETRDWVVPESSIIIEYLALHYPGRTKLIPDDADGARQVRMRDRFVDQYLHTPMQKIPADRLRPADKKDPQGVAEATQMYGTALGMLEEDLAAKRWLMGEEFTMADCAAAPPLYYGQIFFGPLRDSYPNVASYLDRLMERPSYARVLKEAEPFLQMVPR